MPVVSNAGPLIALARIEHLDLLEELFGEVIVPQAVYGEVTRNPDLPGAHVLEQASWLAIHEVGDQVTVQRLRFWLDAGESEAIALVHNQATLSDRDRCGSWRHP